MTQPIFNQLKNIFFLFIFVIFVSYYVLLLLIFAHNVCFFIFNNKPSILNFLLYFFIISLGTYLLTISMEKISLNKDIIKTGFVFEGAIISLYSTYVDDAHIKLFVLSFLSFWNSINKWDNLNKIKYKTRDTITLIKYYNNRSNKKKK